MTPPSFKAPKTNVPWPEPLLATLNVGLPERLVAPVVIVYGRPTPTRSPVVARVAVPIVSVPSESVELPFTAIVDVCAGRNGEGVGERGHRRGGVDDLDPIEAGELRHGRAEREAAAGEAGRERVIPHGKNTVRGARDLGIREGGRVREHIRGIIIFGAADGDGPVSARYVVGTDVRDHFVLRVGNVGKRDIDRGG